MATLFIGASSGHSLSVEESRLSEWLYAEISVRAGRGCESILEIPDPKVLKLLRTEALRAVEPIVGSRRERFGRNEWIYLSEMGRWTVETIIEFNIDNSFMGFEHAIRDNATKLPLVGGINVVRCLGVAGVALPRFLRLSEEDVPDAVAELVFGCRLFMEEVAPLAPQ
jgi:hypothetical protein